MGFYSKLHAAGNTSGMHSFDGSALAALKSDLSLTEEPHETPDPGGETIRLRTAARQLAVERLVVHRNGRTGSRDLTRDTLLLPIAMLAGLPDAIQDLLYDYEQTPDGRRPRSR